MAAGTLLAAATLSCESSAPQSAEQAVLATAPTVVSEPRAVPAAPADVTLGRRADGARLAGLPLPVRPNGDSARVLLLRATGAEERLTGQRVLAAAFVGDAVVTLGVDHVLRAHLRGQSTTLDRGAHGPLSVVGTRVAYVRGEAPRLEVALVDAVTGEPAQLTERMAPCWSPTLAPDAGSVVFVSARSGSPRLYRVEPGAAPEALAQVRRFPSSSIRPRFEGALYVFDDREGTVWVDPETGSVVRTAGRAR